MLAFGGLTGTGWVRTTGLDRMEFSSNNLTTDVQWDSYSLVILGQRVFLQSGEFHTWRLPVPSLWPDIMQKYKAAGLNAVSIYLHWGLTNPSNGTVDFSGVRGLQPLLDACTAAGLFVVVRPGPYINAETTAGGLAHWATSEVAGALRTNASDFQQSWTPYIEGVIDLVKPNQITNGGPVIAVQIDNEYTQSETSGPPGKAGYFVQLEELYRSSGIVVPLTYNDPNENSNYINGTGAVDIYGFDSYPQSFDCSRPLAWEPVVTNVYYSYHMTASPSVPLYIPEFQGGAFDPWGPNAPGYANCRTLTDADFEQVFYQNLWANNVKFENFYMVYGGTSWGYLAFPGVYTSYDYGSAILETRELSPKYAELKRQSFFLRSVPDFIKTDVVGNSTNSAIVNISNPLAYGTYLRNPDTGAGFYIVRQQNSSSLATISLTMQANTSAGLVTLPQSGGYITLHGRASKVITHDIYFGKSHLLFSTLPILFAGSIGGRDILFLYGLPSESHEAAFALAGSSSPNVHTSGPLSLKASSYMSTHTLLDVSLGTTGIHYIWNSPSALVIVADTYTAGTFWDPTIASSATSFSNFYQFGTNETVLVGGPYLVRNASITGNTLALQGDLNGTTPLTVIAPSAVTKVTWNGKAVTIDTMAAHSPMPVGVMTATLQQTTTASMLNIPTLTNWKYADSLPEIMSSYDDSHWVTADHKTTNILDKPIYGDGPVLYGCDYGFCEGAVLWRGHFVGTGNETGVELLINGGEASAASVWLNSDFLGTTYGNSSNNRNIHEETNTVFPFNGCVKAGVDNVVTVIQDNMGLNETQDDNGDDSKCPRGIRGYKIHDDSSFTSWKVQGKIGGYMGFPDKTRGIFNEGGFYGERAGWHLPGFDDSTWETRSLAEGISKAGVGFFRTTFDLSVPADLDVPMSFVFDPTPMAYRALLFVNGWQLGRRVANLGPQYSFPVHQGILDYNGTNTVAVLLWAMEDTGANVPTFILAVNGLYEGGVGGITTDNPVWTSRGLNI